MATGTVQILVWPRPNSTMGQMKNPVAWAPTATKSKMTLSIRFDSLLLRDINPVKNKNKIEIKCISARELWSKYQNDQQWLKLKAIKMTNSNQLDQKWSLWTKMIEIINLTKYDQNEQKDQNEQNWSIWPTMIN